MTSFANSSDRSLRVFSSSSGAVLAAVLLAAMPVRGADEWTQFRGPGGQGHADSQRLPIEFSATNNVRWKAPVPGTGHSSPVISGDQIWLTTAVVTPLTPEQKQAKLDQIKNPSGLDIVGHLSLRAVCLDRKTGHLLHNVEVFSVDDPGPIHSLNSYASPTPVLEPGRVYVHFGTYGTACLETATGTPLWKSQEIHVDHQNGPGSSPIRYGNRLIVHFDGIDRQLIAAFDTQSGNIVWQVHRAGVMNERAEFQKAYCTPSLIDVGGRTILISPAADWVYAYVPETGEEVWRAAYGQLGFSTVPRPVFAHGMVYICTSYIKSRLLAIRYDGQGDVTESHVEWISDSQIPKKPSIVAAGDELYFVSDNGVGTCLDAHTGEQIWRQRFGGNYSASPLYAAGVIYFFSQEGKVLVVKASREFEIVATNELPEGVMASPAVVGDSLFVRTEGHVYRFERD